MRCTCAHGCRFVAPGPYTVRLPCTQPFLASHLACMHNSSLMQVLQLPANVHLTEGTGQVHNHDLCAVTGKRVANRKALGLTMFPRWQTASPRPAITFLAADHPFWKVDSADELYEWLGAAFPKVCAVLSRMHGQARAVNSCPICELAKCACLPKSSLAQAVAALDVASEAIWHILSARSVSIIPHHSACRWQIGALSCRSMWQRSM